MGPGGGIVPRSYLRMLPDLYERKAFGTDKHPPYPPAAIACFAGVLCFGEQQPDRGRFKSRRLLTVLLEGPNGVGRAIARQVGFLIEHGDLIERKDGSLYIEGWDELQEGNWQVAERMARYRERHGAVTPTVTPDVTEPTVTVQSRVDSGKRLADSGLAVAHTARDGLPNLDEDAIDALERRTGRPIQMAGDKQLTEYDRLIADHGLGEVVIAMDKVRQGQTLTARQLVWGAMKVLEPMVDTKKLAEADKAEEAERNSRRGVEATQRYLDQFRPKSQPESIGSIAQRVAPARRESA
jgi:hypothetical protein